MGKRSFFDVSSAIPTKSLVAVGRIISSSPIRTFKRHEYEGRVRNFIAKNEFASQDSTFKITLWNSFVDSFNLEVGMCYKFENFGVKFHSDMKLPYRSEIYLNDASLFELYSTPPNKKMKDQPKKIKKVERNSETPSSSSDNKKKKKINEDSTDTLFFKKSLSGSEEELTTLLIE